MGGTGDGVAGHKAGVAMMRTAPDAVLRLGLCFLPTGAGDEAGYAGNEDFALGRGGGSHADDQTGR